MKNENGQVSSVVLSTFPENIKTMADEKKYEFLQTFLGNIFSSLSPEMNTDIAQVEETTEEEMPNTQE